MERRTSVNHNHNNNNSSCGLEWENLGIYTERSAEIPRQIDFSMSSASSNSGSHNGFCGNIHHHRHHHHHHHHHHPGSSSSSSKYPPFSAASLESTLDDFGKLGYLHPYRNVYDLGGTTISPSGSGEPLTGLRLGIHKEYGDSFPSSHCTTAAKASASSIPVSSVPTKRSRASFQNMQNPCCQVEGCNLDLKLAKDYHRRHRICESHSKSPKVIVAGMERRFCQQCSRFHELSEFDDKKRSCRRRLSDHNARRRRVQPESIHQLASAGMQSSALYDQRPQSVLLNGLPISLTNPTWENASTAMLKHARDLPLIGSPSKAGGIDGAPCFPTSEVHNSISNLHITSERLSSIHGSNPLDQCMHVPLPTNNSPMAAPDLLSAQSLLSSNSWSLNEGESGSSMEGLINYNNNNNNSSSNNSQQQHNLSLFESNNINPAAAAAEGGGGGGGGSVSMVHSISLQDSDSSHLQEFHLFYDPGRFYSTQREL